MCAGDSVSTRERFFRAIEILLFYMRIAGHLRTEHLCVSFGDEIFTAKYKFVLRTYHLSDIEYVYVVKGEILDWLELFVSPNLSYAPSRQRNHAGRPEKKRLSKVECRALSTFGLSILTTSEEFSVI